MDLGSQEVKLLTDPLDPGLWEEKLHWILQILEFAQASYHGIRDSWILFNDHFMGLADPRPPPPPDRLDRTSMNTHIDVKAIVRYPTSL